MFIPKIKQKVGGKLNGTLVDPTTNLEYKGTYVQDYLGNFYKGNSISSNSKPLIFVEDRVKKEKFKKDNFAFTFRKPTEKDYIRKKYTRYFYKDQRNGIIKELNKEKFNFHRKQKKSYIQLLELKWNLGNSKEKEEIEVLRVKNENIIKEAEKVLPGISKQVLKSPLQFVI